VTLPWSKRGGGVLGGGAQRSFRWLPSPQPHKKHLLACKQAAAARGVALATSAVTELLPRPNRDNPVQLTSPPCSKDVSSNSIYLGGVGRLQTNGLWAVTDNQQSASPKWLFCARVQRRSKEWMHSVNAAISISPLFKQGQDSERAWGRVDSWGKLLPRTTHCCHWTDRHHHAVSVRALLELTSVVGCRVRAYDHEGLRLNAGPPPVLSPRHSSQRARESSNCRWWWAGRIRRASCSTLCAVANCVQI